MLESFLIKLQASKFIEKRLQHWCFLLRIRKFLRTPILKNISELVLLIILLLQQYMGLYAGGLYNRDEKSVSDLMDL